MLPLLSTLLMAITDRVRTLRADQRGYSTEAVVVTALLVAMALTVVAIIAEAIRTKAHNIPL